MCIWRETGTEPHSLLYMFPMAAFMLKGRMEALHPDPCSPQSLKYLLIWPFTEGFSTLDLDC